jgi:AAA domain
MVEGHQQVLISALMNGRADLPVGEYDFTEPNLTIYQAWQRLSGNRGLLAVQDELKRLRKFKEVGGEGRLTEIFNLPHDADSVAYALEQVLEASRERQAREVVARYSKGQLTAEELNQRLAEILARARTKPGKRLYTMMAPEEILALPVDPDTNLLADFLLTKGGSLAIIGQPDLGKTRLVMQLFAALILMRTWCELETRAKDCRIVFFQSENSVYRLKQDLDRLKKWAGKDWPRVNDNLLVHVIKHDDDLSHYLSDPENVSRMEKIVQEFDATIVAFDVLQDFKVGDLKEDVDMEATVAAMKRITRVGNPNRSMIVVLHALTGRAGAAKAFGYDRTSFARGSKVILGTVRGAVNVAPGAEDYSVLLLFCGKNNDGKRFPDTAIRPDEDMIYQVDPDFDIEGWKQQIGSNKPTESYDPTDLRDWLQKDKEYDRPDIVEIIKDETGHGKTWAYVFIRKAIKKRVLKCDSLTKIYKLL